jgi:RNase P/RNase MRP subunit p29
MPIVKENVLRHELIGLKAIVECSSNPSHNGICGVIIDETKGMIVLYDGIKIKKIQKKNTCFNVQLPDCSEILIDGNDICTRSFERVSKYIRRKIK